MTTVELLAYCGSRKPYPLAPDLVWQHEAHRSENLRPLCNGDDDGDTTPGHGFHDMRDVILETQSWLRTVKRTYATVVFKEGAACSEPQR